MGLVEESTIFKDRNALAELYIPSELRVRRKEATLLTKKVFARFSEGRAGDVAAIFGSPGRSGIGKTTVAKYSGLKISELAARHGIKYKFIYVNVYSAPSLHEILAIIASQLSPKINIKGSSTLEAIKTIVDYVYEKNYYVLVTIDEFQNLIKSPKVDDAYLYSLLRIYEQVPPPDGVPRISYILVASDYLVLSELRSKMPQIESQINFRLHLKPYTVEELYEILEQRAEISLYEGTWTPEILYMIAEHYGVDGTGLKDGNARRAINALNSAAEQAEYEGSHRITPEHVRHALSLDSIANVSISDLEGLSTHELLVLLAVAKHTVEEGEWLTTGRLRQLYNELSELYGEAPRAHTQFNIYINNLKSIQLLDVRPSGKGMRGRTSIIRLRTDIPAKPLVEVIEEILKKRLP
ncbi:MAG: AAA family ATPase [Desulfurococcales archaeon]|nr:AAA family ATPase [Desulfurococcales archaeon]